MSNSPVAKPISKEMAEEHKKLAQHDKICNEIHNLYRRKNADYGGAIENGVNALGWCYLYSQLWNKTQRFINLTSNPNRERFVDESLEDTLLDLANYAIEGVRILRSRRE